MCNYISGRGRVKALESLPSPSPTNRPPGSDAPVGTRLAIMIINRSIFGKLSKITVSDKELIRASISAFNPDKCQCPTCKARGMLHPIASYDRHMVSEGKYIGNEPPLITIPRYECNSCGHTHALLGYALTPCSPFTVTFIIKVLYGYLNRPGRVDDFCESMGISVTTLYNWIHLFNSRYNSWCKALDRMASLLCSSALDIVCSFDDVLDDFMSRFSFPFLGRKTSPSRPPSPCVAAPGGAGTSM